MPSLLKKKPGSFLGPADVAAERLSRFDIPASVCDLLMVASQQLSLDTLDLYALAVNHGRDWRALAGELTEYAYATRHGDGGVKHAAVCRAADRVCQEIPRA